MRWYRVLGPQLVSDVRWLRLSLPERGAWITLANLAAGKEPPGVLASRDEAEALLQRESADDAVAMLTRLLSVGMVEMDDAGALSLSVGIDWGARPPSAEPEAIRERVARHRDRHRNDPSNDPASLRNDRQTDKTEKKRETPHAPANGGPSPVGSVMDRLLEGGLDPDIAARIRKERPEPASPSQPSETPGAER